MSDLVVETPEGVTLHHPLAGAGSRSAAGILDLLLFALLMLLALVGISVFQPIDQVVFQGVVQAIFLAGFLLLLIGYHALFPLVLGGATPGKRVLGLRVVDRRGWPASPVQHFLRALFWPLEVALAVPVPIGILLQAVTTDHQRLGDLVANTVVLREPRGRDRGERQVREPFRRDRWDTLPVRRLDLVPALVEGFDGRDLAFLRELFGRVGLDPEARRRIFREAARHYERALGRTPSTQLGAEEAAATLRELYLYLRDRQRT